ncbi:hypothetical protein WOLCODRAFT_140093 [Wolfiporia cocos MD-104 SS10]|uniref:Transmembrane protein n=1 Tax=Wolfiporia cocos (strain MD-104) TaxID=742152 RepID=A0A2H3JAN5_WOLCO|nr:hypothetical protein WOLCODRAFT_140093 [Wolfiporia cocos MD-104 SS10]
MGDGYNSNAKLHQFAAAGQSSEDSALRQAILQVVQIWLNRLSLVSGIASFFASIDSLLFSLASTATHLGDPESTWSATDKLTTASFAGALIFHVCSAILAFVASFVLVKLQLVDANDQEAKVEVVVPGEQHENTALRDAKLRVPSANGHQPTSATSVADDVPVPVIPSHDTNKAVEDVMGRVSVQCAHPLSFLSLPAVRLSRNPPVAGSSTPADALLDPPIELLSRCHALAVWMSVLGFILGVIGILAYAWVATPLAVSVFSTVCLGVCFLTGIIAVW